MLSNIISKNIRHVDLRKGFKPSDQTHQNCYTAALGIPSDQRVLVQKPGSLFRPALSEVFLARAGLLKTLDSSKDSLIKRIQDDGLIEANITDLERGYNLLGAWSCAADQDYAGLGDFHFRTYFPDGIISESFGNNTKEHSVSSHEDTIRVVHTEMLDSTKIRRERCYTFAGFFRLPDDGIDISFWR